MSNTTPTDDNIHLVDIVQLIAISDIAIINRQRKSMDETRVRELADSIKANGFIQPIVVRNPIEGEQTQGKRYVLSVGGRRIAAHLFLGRTHIRAIQKEDITDPLQARIVELEENVRRENLTWQDENAARVELAELYRELIGTRPMLPGSNQPKPTASITELAEKVGVSASQLSRDMQLHAAMKKDPSLKAAASKGSAHRTAQFKVEINDRLAKATANKDSNVSALREKLHTADGAEFIKTIPSHSIDLLFSDLPYGKDHYDVQGADENAKGFYDDSADAAKAFISKIIPEALRVVKPTGWIVFFMGYEWHQWLQEEIRDHCTIHNQRRLSTTYSNDLRTYCQTGINNKEPCDFRLPEMPPWIWTRRGRGNHGHWPEFHASNRYEMLVVVNLGQARLAKKPVENVLDYPPFSGDRLHSMQKPHELCREVIERTTVVGERVADICFGSGAHLAAAASLGRDFVGCDNNPDNLPSALTLVGQYYHGTGARAIARGKSAVLPQPRKVEG